jgi:aromatic ring-opening dioxygenase LigB subunit
MRGCVCPHPPLLVPQIGGDDLQAVQSTVAAMEELAGDAGVPETIVIVSPHTPGFADAHTIKTGPRLRGDFVGFRAPSVRLEIENDLELVDALLGAAEREGVPLAPVATGELDHGVLVPLYFLRAQRLVSLSIISDYGAHVALGRLVRRCVAELGRDVVFVASGDLSHRLVPGAPAGYDPRGAVFDRSVVDLLSEGDFGGLLGIDKSTRSGAGECGLRSFVALGGFLADDAARSPHVYSYEGPFGVGYLVAGFGLVGEPLAEERS